MPKLILTYLINFLNLFIFTSLMTNYGLIDTLSVFFSNIRGPLDEEQQTAEILANCLNFLISITKFLTLK